MVMYEHQMDDKLNYFLTRSFGVLLGPDFQLLAIWGLGPWGLLLPLRLCDAYFYDAVFFSDVG